MVIVHSKLLVYWRVSGTSTRDLSTQLWQKCDVINLNGFTRMGCTPLQVAMGKPSSQRKIIIPTFSWVQISELEQRVDWLKLKESFFFRSRLASSPHTSITPQRPLDIYQKKQKKVSKVVFPTILGFQCGPVFLFENPLLRPSTPTQAGRSAPPTSMVFIQPWMWSEDPQGEAFTT